MEDLSNVSYEQALGMLQEIVRKLERKEVKIDELSKSVVKANELVEICRKKLDKTEEEINKIIQNNTK
jgi:exodeoxyribonuclease VII small subunit